MEEEDDEDVEGVRDLDFTFKFTFCSLFFMLQGLV